MSEPTNGSATGRQEPAIVPAPATPSAGLPAPGAVDADAVAAAVLSCPEVNTLSSGQFGEVATYLPGRRVDGVRITTDMVDVHVAVIYGVPLQQIAAQIRRTLIPVTAGLPVNITFDAVTAD